jgi:cell division protease FtsH
MPKKNKKNELLRSILVIVIVGVVLTSLYTFSGLNLKNSVTELPFSDIKRNYEADNIESIEVKDNKIYFFLKDGEKHFAIKEPGSTLNDLGIDSSKVDIKVIDTNKNRFWIDLSLSIFPILLIFLFLFFVFKQAQGSSNSAFSFGKSKAKLFDENNKKRFTFKDVAGVKEAKEELTEIVDFLRSPQKYIKIGAKIPRGVIMFGPPGTGKTLLARAVAGEANVPFFSISGSEFVEMFVGVGASRVRDLFSKAKKNSPSIIFIDEIDAVGRHRGAGLGGGHDEREQTLNQILVEMDGFDNQTNVIVMAATNRPDILDPAILRPGRFDRRVTIDLPDIESRKEILEVHANNKPLVPAVDLDKIAKQTPGFSGADLANLMNESAILAARYGKKKISMEELENAIEKVLLGPERKSRVLNEEERKITAYHEAGHAIVGHFMKHCDPVHKISIVSRGQALGVTWYMPDRDLHLQSKSKFKDELAALLGGRVAEEVIFSEITTGASNDLKRATDIARKMVVTYGMSDKLGLRVYGEEHGSVFLGRELSGQKNYSEEIASKIDEEVSDIIDTAHKQAHKLLKEHREKLDELGELLLKQETVSREEFLKLVREKDSK